MYEPVEAVDRNGKIELLETLADSSEDVAVMVTFLESHSLSLRARGIDKAHGAEIRACLTT